MKLNSTALNELDDFGELDRFKLEVSQSAFHPFEEFTVGVVEAVRLNEHRGNGALLDSRPLVQSDESDAAHPEVVPGRFPENLLYSAFLDRRDCELAGYERRHVLGRLGLGLGHGERVG